MIINQTGITRSVISVASFSLSGSLKNQKVDHMLLYITENSGSVHFSDADLSLIRVMVTHRPIGGSPNVLVNATLADLSFVTNFRGGHARTTTNNTFVGALIRLGRIDLTDGSELFVEVYGSGISITPSHYCSVKFVDSQVDYPYIVKYESRTVATDSLLPSCVELYQNGGLGTDIHMIQTREGQISIREDDANYWSQMSGEYETEVAFCQLWKSTDGSPQDISIKPGASSNILIVSVE